MHTILLKISMVILCFVLVTCTSKTQTDVDTNKIKQTASDSSNSSSKNGTLKDTSKGAATKKTELIQVPAQKKSAAQAGWVLSRNSEWYALYNRLKKNSIYGEDVDTYFMQLEGQFSQKPMGIKVKELYNTSFEKKAKKAKQVEDTSPNSTGVPRPWYKNYVTKINAQKCRDFINANQEAFDYTEKKYNIPAEVISALIYIETKHGNYLGEHNPFINLASMANSTKMEQIPRYIKDLPRAKEKKKWVLNKMKEKSDWAYTELESLLVYCRKNNLDPFMLPSSVYGALGYGQFMPTNIPHYAVDGNNDGIINLFQPADGIASVGNFLYKHGWNKSNLTLSKKLRVLKRYNYSSVYANTIMALSVLTSRTK